MCALMRESTCSGERGLTLDKRALCLGALLWKEAEAEMLAELSMFVRGQQGCGFP